MTNMNSQELISRCAFGNQINSNIFDQNILINEQYLYDDENMCTSVQTLYNLVTSDSSRGSSYEYTISGKNNDKKAEHYSNAKAAGKLSPTTIIVIIVSIVLTIVALLLMYGYDFIKNKYAKPVLNPSQVQT